MPMIPVFGRFSGEDREMSMQTKVLLAVVALGAVWIGIQTGMVSALLATGLASPTGVGLLVLALIGYWALDELEDDDDASDVVSKTTDRAENASKGFLDGTTALILGVVGVVGTVGMELFDLLANFADMALSAPLAAAQLGTLGVGVAAVEGVISSPTLVAVGLGLLALAYLARRREED